MIVYSKRDIPGPCSYDNPAISKPGGARQPPVCGVYALSACDSRTPCCDNCSRVGCLPGTARRPVCADLTGWLGAGGRFSTAAVPNYIDVEVKRTCNIPGPGQYAVALKPQVSSVSKPDGRNIRPTRSASGRENRCVSAIDTHCQT